MSYSHTARRLDDPGLQPERTSLAWFRTLLVMICISILFFKLAIKKQDALLIVASVILLLSNIGAFAYAYKRNFLDIKTATITSYGSVIVKRILCCSIIFSAFIFSISSVVDFFTVVAL